MDLHKVRFWDSSLSFVRLSWIRITDKLAIHWQGFAQVRLQLKLALSLSLNFSLNFIFEIRGKNKMRSNF